MHLRTKFDLLKIDIDSVDCEVLQAVLSVRKPLVVSIEINPAFPPPISFNMKWHTDVQHQVGSPSVLYGCSLSFAIEVAYRQGYELLHFSLEDAYFVQKKHS